MLGEKTRADGMMVDVFESRTRLTGGPLWGAKTCFGAKMRAE